MNPAARTPATGPLSGLRIVEVAGLGPITFAAMLLADMGADVVRAVRPGHVEMEKGATLRGRRQTVIDLRTHDGREALLQLVDVADVLLEGFRPGVMERLELGPNQTLQRNARLVYGRMTGWGQSGPRAALAGHDVNYIAVSGALHAIGQDDPTIPLNLVGDYGAGALYLAMGVIAAALHARQSGMGQIVDCAICDGTASLLSLMHGLRHVGRWNDERHSNTLDGAAPYYRTYRCKDGKAISVGAIEPQFYRSLLEHLNLQGSALFANQHDRSRWREQATTLQAHFATRSRDEWTELFDGSDSCVTPVNSLAESTEDPHLRARGTFLSLHGEIQPAPAPRFSATPSAVRATCAVANPNDILRDWRAVPRP